MDRLYFKNYFNKNLNIVIVLILFMALLPPVKIFSFQMPVLYLLTPIQVLLLAFFLYKDRNLPSIFYIIMFLFILILFEIFLSTIHGTIKTLGNFVFPTDMFQYIARFLTMSMFFYFGYYDKVETDVFIKYFLSIMNIGMLIGILQWIPWFGREFFINAYPFRDGSLQLSHLSRSLQNIRMHGFAQHATANGGLATFFFVFGLSILLFYRKHKSLSISLLILSVINIFASQARAGMLALVFALFLFYIMGLITTKRYKEYTKKSLIFLLTILFIGYMLYLLENPFIHHMLYRWKVLFQTSGGSRVDQATYFLNQFSNAFDYLLGLSKPVVNASKISHGVEIEPINIFVLYGIVGWLLQYGLVVVLLIYFIKKIISSTDSKTTVLLTASFIGLFSYQIFSVAYFFFREMRVGLFPWILIGMTIGVVERQRRNNKKNIRGD